MAILPDLAAPRAVADAEVSSRRPFSFPPIDAMPLPILMGTEQLAVRGRPA